MSFVTLGDKAKALQMVGLGSGSQDRLLLSLAQQTMWTHNQRSLVDRMWRERQRKRADSRLPMADGLNKAADMKTETVLCVGIAMTFALMAGCASTYEKRFLDHDGKPVVITEQHEPDWWNNLGTPDWMNVRHETITRDGQVVADRTCTHEPTTPTILNCENARE